MELLNNIWMNIYNPNDFFQVLILFGIILISYLLIIPNRKYYEVKKGN